MHEDCPFFNPSLLPHAPVCLAIITMCMHAPAIALFVIIPGCTWMDGIAYLILSMPCMQISATQQVHAINKDMNGRIYRGMGP